MFTLQVDNRGNISGTGVLEYLTCRNRQLKISNVSGRAQTPNTAPTEGAEFRIWFECSGDTFSGSHRQCIVSLSFRRKSTQQKVAGSRHEWRLGLAFLDMLLRTAWRRCVYMCGHFRVISIPKMQVSSMHVCYGGCGM